MEKEEEMIPVKWHSFALLHPSDKNIHSWNNTTWTVTSAREGSTRSGLSLHSLTQNTVSGLPVQKKCFDEFRLELSVQHLLSGMENSYMFNSVVLLFSMCGHLPLLSWVASSLVLMRPRSEGLSACDLLSFALCHGHWLYSSFFFPPSLFLLWPADLKMHAVHHKGAQSGDPSRVLELEVP